MATRNMWCFYSIKYVDGRMAAIIDENKSASRQTIYCLVPRSICYFCWIQSESQKKKEKEEIIIIVIIIGRLLLLLCVLFIDVLVIPCALFTRKESAMT